MALKKQYAVAVVNEDQQLETNSVVILDGEEDSSVINCAGTAPTGVILPSDFVSCNLSFLTSQRPNDTYVPITNFDGTAFSVAAAASTRIPLQPAMFNSVIYLKLSCDAAQDSDVIIEITMAPIFQGIHN